MPRTANVFLTNRSQAVSLPKEYQFSIGQVFIRKVREDVSFRYVRATGTSAVQVLTVSAAASQDV
jgi:virulence-associated protein VagC